MPDPAPTERPAPGDPAQPDLPDTPSGHRMLREARLARALVRPGGLWSEVRVLPETGSTNADVAEAARAGAAEGLIVIAERQVAGRGRMGRSWQAPRGAALTMSVLVRPRSVAAARLGWLPLLTGVAVVEACASEGGVDAALKWPNDLLVRPTAPEPSPARDADSWGKGGGILAEAATPDAIVIGMGINVYQSASDLPTPADPAAYPPTSLALAGASCDRERLAVTVLRRLAHWYGRWLSAGGDPDPSGLAAAYRGHCRTLGREVTVTLPGDVVLRGTAPDVDPDGRLVVRAPDREHRLAAGDVHHVRAPIDRFARPDTSVSAEAPLARTH